MASVSVRGSAAASVTPDRAELCLELTHRAPDAAGALDEVARRSDQLASILVTHGFSATDWATEGVQVGEEYQWKNDRNVLIGYRAGTALTVTIRSLDLVGAVIRDAVTDAGANVRSLTWKVDRDNPARRSLLADAARDAKVRATAYTEALDLTLGEVELISELPIVMEPGPQPRAMMGMAMDAKMSAGQEIELSGGLVELTADVHVQFRVQA